MIVTENAKQILQTLAWIDTIQAHDGATIAMAEHRAGLKLLADEFCAAIEGNHQLRAKLRRKGKAGRKMSKNAKPRSIKQREFRAKQKDEQRRSGSG